MQFGYSRKEILSLLDTYLNDVNQGFENQIKRMRDEKVEPELSLATLLTSSMLSMLEAVSGVIEMNNRKLLQDLVEKGLLNEDVLKEISEE